MIKITKSEIKSTQKNLNNKNNQVVLIKKKDTVLMEFFHIILN